MGEFNEETPSGDEFMVTGLFGACLFMLLAMINLHALYNSPKNKLTRYFFILMLLMSLLEIPRYLNLAMYRAYDSRFFYSIHMLASLLFFAAFSIVCIQWTGLLKLGSLLSVLYSMRGLLIANTAFGICDIVGIILCGVAPSLHEYFRSYGYEVYVFIDTFKNLFYSSFLSFYGLKLIMKLYRYRAIEVKENLFSREPTEHFSSAFGAALKRLTSVLVIATLCFILRVTMLILKSAALHSSFHVSSPGFPLFGFLWFTCSDFIPRCVPSFAFVYLMRTRKKDLTRQSSGPLLPGPYSFSRGARLSIDLYSRQFRYVGDDQDEVSVYTAEDRNTTFSEASDSGSEEDENAIIFVGGDASPLAVAKRRQDGGLSHNHSSWSNFAGPIPGVDEIPHSPASSLKAETRDDDISLTSFASLSERLLSPIDNSKKNTVKHFEV
jgi:hypothetical protein